MPARLTEAHEHAVAHDEWIAEPHVGIGRRDVDVPAGEVLPLKSVCGCAATRRETRRTPWPPHREN